MHYLKRKMSLKFLQRGISFDEHLINSRKLVLFQFSSWHFCFITWESAVRERVLHLKGSRAWEGTVRERIPRISDNWNCQKLSWCKGSPVIAWVIKSRFFCQQLLSSLHPQLFPYKVMNVLLWQIEICMFFLSETRQND